MPTLLYLWWMVWKTDKLKIEAESLNFTAIKKLDAVKTSYLRSTCGVNIMHSEEIRRQFSGMIYYYNQNQTLNLCGMKGKIQRSGLERMGQDKLTKALEGWYKEKG